MPEAGATEVGEGLAVPKVEPTKTEEVKQVETTKETKEYSAQEQEAMEQGWDPNFEGDNKRSAREFLDRGELLGKIKSQSTELREIKKALDGLSAHNKNVYAAGYEKALVDLRAAKVKAIDENDGSRVVQLDDAIDQTKKALADIKAAPAVKPQSETESFRDFKKANPLYEKDEDFVAWSHGVAIQYAKAHPDAEEAEVYANITERAKKRFPEQARKGPPSPDGAGRSSGGNSGADKSGSKAFDALMSTLPEDQSRVARDLVKRGYVTKEKYVTDYENIPR